MSSRVIEIFEEIVSIEHCSFKAQKLAEYIVDFAKRCGYMVEVDRAGNILAYTGKPKISLQSHYDMVCVGKAPDIKLKYEDNWLSAKESSLGADNGIGVAMMLALIESGYELEYLFTSDEEVGLVGAKALEFSLNSQYMLNLDTEEEGVVYIGCAGGCDVVASLDTTLEQVRGYGYRVSVSNLPGGHSGIMINRDIPNAIIELTKFIDGVNGYIVEFRGGERRNSIPVNATATIITKEPLGDNQSIDIEYLGEIELECYPNSSKILKKLLSFRHGVKSFDSKLGIPHSSANLAIVECNKGSFEVVCSLRSMDNSDLNSFVKETKEFWLDLGCSVSIQECYPAWKPTMDSWKEIVLDSIKSTFANATTKAIHAGLECGVISQKYPNISIASIGPNIQNPHSIKERVDIKSVNRVYSTLIDIVNKYK